LRRESIRIASKMDSNIISISSKSNKKQGGGGEGGERYKGSGKKEGRGREGGGVLRRGDEKRQEMSRRGRGRGDERA